MLTLAAAFGRAAVVNILCQIKGDPSIENAKVGCSATQRYNITFITHAQVASRQGWSAVHVAAVTNRLEVMEAMINLGVSVDLPDARLGFAPLHLAASVDHIQVLELLWQSGKADFARRARNVSRLSLLH